MHAGTTLVGNTATIIGASIAPNAIMGRWFAKQTTFKMQQGEGSVFFVHRGGALALDSCSVQDADNGSAVQPKGCRADPPEYRYCTYSDGTPFNGATLQWQLRFMGQRCHKCRQRVIATCMIALQTSCLGCSTLSCLE
jgi:hypothetical protein